MIKKILAVILTLLPLLPSGAQEKETFLRQLQKRDSVLIADQLVYGATLEGITEGAALVLPEYDKAQLTEGVEIVKPWQLDTIKKHKDNVDVEASLTITSFDEGEYSLPDLKIARTLKDGTTDTLVFKGRPLTVTTIPVDTTTFTVHDLRGQIGYPLTFAEVLPYILIVLAVILLAVVIFFVIRYFRKRKGAIFAPPEPAHIVALRKLDQLRGNKYWAPEKQKLYYSGITDALREYIASRYEFGAMEMTTAEIFKYLKTIDFPAEYKEPLKDLFETSDFVKFAKMTVDDDYNAKALPLAVRFVTDTYQTQLDEESEAAPEKETEKK
ncbi:MAG: hypothetical protein IJ151_02325 [Bacteroidales bacterium]|nr:hypothetical protein [Bacteroidales bacterium]